MIPEDDELVVEERLYQAIASHEAGLASLTSISVASATAPVSASPPLADAQVAAAGGAAAAAAGSSLSLGGGNGVIKSSWMPTGRGGVFAESGGADALLDPAARRSACSYLDGGGIGGGSAAAATGDSVSAVCMNPPDRVVPHLIVRGMRPLLGGQDNISGGEVEIGSSSEEDEAFKVFTALSALCEEASELDSMASTSILPAILLFAPHPHSGSADLGRGAKGGKVGGAAAAAAARLDERAVRAREEELIRRMGKFLRFLQGVYNLALRCQRLAKNMVCQIAGCYGDGPVHPFLTEYGGKAQLVPLGQALATVLRILITIDASVSSNSELLEAWNLYKGIVKERLHDIKEELGDGDRIEALERLIVQLDFSLLSSRSFLASIDQNFDSVSSIGKSYRSNSSLHDEVKSMISALYDRYCAGVGSNSETTERRDLVGVYGLYALYRRLLPSNAMPDSKLHRHLWTAFPHRCPVINLIGDVAFYPRDFMNHYAPFEVRGCDQVVALSDAVAFVDQFDNAFPSEASKCRTEAIGWVAFAESELAGSVVAQSNGSKDNNTSQVEAVGALLLKGLVIAHRSSVLMRTLLTLHKSLEIPLPSKFVPSLLSLFESLKSIEQIILYRRRAAVTAVLPPALRLIASTIFRVYEPMRVVVDEHKSMGRSSTFAMDRDIAKLNACLSVMEGTLKGSSTFGPARSSTAALACCFCAGFCSSSEKDFAPDVEMALALLRRLQLLADIDECIRDACDCASVYFHKELLPLFVRESFQSVNGLGVGRFQLVLSALSDPGRVWLRCTPHLESSDAEGCDTCISAYRSSVLKILQEEVIRPICHEVESGLRLAIHEKNFGRGRGMCTNPKTTPTRKILPFLEMPPLHILGINLDLKRCVEQYLEATFYNLTTVAIHDAKTYIEMSFLANEKYGLELADYNLPMGSLVQGFDVLQIMRNIHVFVKRFNYNLNQQNFIERSPENGSKYLNTVSIESISASLRQHGIGSVNSSVNYTYQFLTKKFQLLSQFLLDNYIRSYLSKEVRWFYKLKNDGGGMYPYQRALSLVKEIKKLGVGAHGEGLLDQFRILISEVGNALGFVRLVRSAGMRFCSGVMQFSPEPLTASKSRISSMAAPVPPMKGRNKNARTDSDNDSEIEICNKCELSRDSQRAAKNMVKVQSSLFQYFNNDTDYCKVLVQVFRNVVLDSDHVHLDNFYVLVPALCLGWLESSQQANEMMHKKNRTGDAYYTDDGFALGVAFILSILNQKELFDSLNWFSALTNQFSSSGEGEVSRETMPRDANIEDRASFVSSLFGVQSMEEENVYSGNEGDIETANVPEKQSKEKRREAERLSFSMEGAQVFFRSV